MTGQRNYRWLMIVQLYLVTALWGAVQVGGENKVLEFLFTAFQASAVSLWVVLDARANDADRPGAARLFLFDRGSDLPHAHLRISSRHLSVSCPCCWNISCESGSLLRDALSAVWDRCLRSASLLKPVNKAASCRDGLL